MTLGNRLRDSLGALSPDDRQRHDLVMAKAMETFGSRSKAYIWLHRYNAAIAAGSRMPMHIACTSDEGLHEVLAELIRISPQIADHRLLHTV
jgi:uncharacterized protein (DUF2384 family)